MAIVLLSLLLVNFVVSPAFAARIIEVTKEIDVKKTTLSKALTDLKIYQEIFPQIVKSVSIDPNTGRTKFVIDAVGTHEVDVKSSVQSNGVYVVEILSGDLKGSKITTTLKERVGFDGTPNGATIVKTTLALETSWLLAIPMSSVSDDTINNEVGNGFYKVGQYLKTKYPEPKGELVNLDYKEKSSHNSNIVENYVSTPKLEAAKKLDPKKEAQRFELKPKETVKTTKLEATKKLEAGKTTSYAPIIPKSDQSKIYQKQKSDSRTKSYVKP